MEPSQELADQLYVDKVLAARQRTLDEKLRAGGDLFEAAIERMRMGILMDNPQATEVQILQEIQRRLAISRLLENARESQ